jgi:hypothetical protein
MEGQGGAEAKEASFFKTRVGANFAPRRQLEHRHHCCVGANLPHRRKLCFKKLAYIGGRCPQKTLH